MARSARSSGEPEDPRLAQIRALVRATPPEVLDRISGRAPWRRAVSAAWSPPVLLVAALIFTPLYLAYASSAGWPDGTMWSLLLMAMAAGAALTFAGYLRVVDGRPRLGLGGSPCAAVSGFFPVVAALALATTTAPNAAGMPATAAGGWMALGLVLLGLSNRVTGAIMCPPRS
ncbi:MAG: hypothetical protein IPM08_06485 [Actinomycetales bacterium]|nr:hypothetical protein [Actinomycetales bacterium]